MRHRSSVLIAVVLALVGCAKGESGPDPRVREARERGEELFVGRGACVECHTFGEVGDKVRAPNLAQGEPRTAAYVAASIVDPDAQIAKGFVRGVMKPPDQPPVSLTDDDIVDLALYLSGDDDFGGALAAIAPARAAREERARQSHLDNEIRRVSFVQGDATRGAKLYESLGCVLCHGNRRHSTKAPDLAVSGKRLSKDDMARWLIAPPATNMPSYGHCTAPQEVADLCEYMTTLQ